MKYASAGRYVRHRRRCFESCCGPQNLELILETYDLMSKKYFIHATPTLFNSGTPHPQMSSCFLVHMKVGRHAGSRGLPILPSRFTNT